MWNEFPFIKGELQKVEKLLEKSVRTRNVEVESVVRNFVINGGKRVRPVLALSGASFGNYDSNTAVAVAGSIELMHAATLIHDDIIDNSDLRRGQSTVHVTLGSDVAVFCGDFLLTKSFDMIADIADVSLMKQMSKALKYVCDCEIDQNLSRFNKNVSVYRYLKRIMGKTAALFALSLSTGAYMSGCDRELCKTLAKIGSNIGMAFQIIDDVLDFEGNEEVVGKSLLNDALTGVYTLPLIYAFNSGFKDKIKEAINVLKIDDGGMIYSIISESKGLERSRNLAKKYLDRASSLSRGLKDTEGKKVVEFLIETQLNRTF